MSLKKKINLLVLLSALVPLALVAGLSYWKSRLSLIDRVEHQLMSIAHIKQTEIQKFFHEKHEVLDFIDGDIMVNSAFEEFLELDNRTSERWKSLDQKYVEHFKNLCEHLGLYDIFLIAPEGRIVYTMAKEADLGMNLVSDADALQPFAGAFAEIRKNAKIAFADLAPYGPSNGDPAAFLIQPYRREGQLKGYLAIQLSIDQINEMMKEQAGMGETGETYLVGPDFLMRSDSRHDPQGHSVKASLDHPEQGAARTDSVDQALAGKSGVQIIRAYHGAEVLSAYAPVDVFGRRWALVAEEEADEALSPLVDLLIEIGWLTVLVALAVLCSSLWFGSRLARPLIYFSEWVRALAESKDFRERLSVRGRDEIALMGAELNHLLEVLHRAFGQVNDGANLLGTASEQLSATAAQIQAATEEVNASIGESSGSVQETQQNMVALAGSIDRINQGVEKIRQLSLQTTSEADLGRKSMEESRVAVEAIAQGSMDIVGIIEVITEIANQTNLLSLNAAIEAAKAGDSGKGFAVVADEVRNLALRSNNSVEQIRELIEQSAANVNQGTFVIENTGQVLNRIAEQVGAVEQQVHSISQDLGGQNLSAVEVSRAMEEVSQAAETNAASMGQLASSITEMEATIIELRGMAEQLRSEVGQFQI